MKTPQLTYDPVFNRWMLWLPRGDVAGSGYDTERSFCMVIHCEWRGEERGWFDYSFLEWDMGDDVEVDTDEQYQDRVETICSHEGEEIAKIWEQGQDQVKVVREDHPVFALRKHWEAMMQLELFFPSVNLKAWQGKPLNKETIEKMDDLRDQQMREAADAMHEPDGDDYAEEAMDDGLRGYGARGC
jgi:hypothetical protein